MSFRERLPVSLLALESVRRRLLGGLGVRPRSVEVGTISTSGFEGEVLGGAELRASSGVRWVVGAVSDGEAGAASEEGTSWTAGALEAAGEL